MPILLPPGSSAEERDCAVGGDRRHRRFGARTSDRSDRGRSHQVDQPYQVVRGKRQQRLPREFLQALVPGLAQATVLVELGLRVGCALVRRVTPLLALDVHRGIARRWRGQAAAVLRLKALGHLDHLPVLRRVGRERADVPLPPTMRTDFCLFVNQFAR